MCKKYFVKRREHFLCYEASITLVPKPDKDSIKNKQNNNKNYRPLGPKKLYTMTKWIYFGHVRKAG